MNQRVLALGMAKLGAAHGGRELTPAMFGVYAEGLADVSESAFLKAVQMAVIECEFFPSVAELRRMALGEDRERAAQALMAVEQLIGRHGGLLQNIPASEVAALDAPTRAGLASAGWLSAVRNATAETRPALERVFTNAYRAALRLPPTPAELTSGNGRRALPPSEVTP